MFEVSGRYSASCWSSSQELQVKNMSGSSGKCREANSTARANESSHAAGSSGPLAGMCTFSANPHCPLANAIATRL